MKSLDIKFEKQLVQTVCICKGIKLKTILRALWDSKSVCDVNNKTGSGSGGCKGTRCSPRIKLLLNKKEKMEER